MRELELLAKKHKRWCALVRSMGCNPAVIEDVVQDSYLKIREQVLKGRDITYGDSDVNDFYMYLTLRSVYLTSVGKKKLNVVETDQETLDQIMDSIESVYCDYEQEEAFRRLEKNIYREINSWDTYYTNIFIGYFTTDMSLDKMSKDSVIGRSSLYNSLVKHKEIIKDMFSEDVEDFFNGDYNHIK